MTSSTQNESNKVNRSTLVKGDPPEGKTTAVAAVMRGNLKHDYHRHRSNKHYKKQIVRVLLDSGSDRDLVFVNKDKPMLLPYSKRLVPQLWNTSNGIFQTKRKARVELNFFDYSDSKKYFSEPDCENIHSWISLVGDLVFSHQGEFYGFKFPKRFFGDLFQRSHSLFDSFFSFVNPNHLKT